MTQLLSDSLIHLEQKVIKAQNTGHPTSIQKFRVDYDHLRLLMSLNFNEQFALTYKTWEQTNKHQMNYEVRTYFWNLYVLVRDGHVNILKKAYEQTAAQA